MYDAPDLLGESRDLLQSEAGAAAQGYRRRDLCIHMDLYLYTELDYSFQNIN